MINRSDLFIGGTIVYNRFTIQVVNGIPMRKVILCEGLLSEFGISTGRVTNLWGINEKEINLDWILSIHDDGPRVIGTEVVKEDDGKISIRYKVIDKGQTWTCSVSLEDLDKIPDEDNLPIEDRRYRHGGPFHVEIQALNGYYSITFRVSILDIRNWNEFVCRIEEIVNIPKELNKHFGMKAFQCLIGKRVIINERYLNCFKPLED